MARTDIPVQTVGADMKLEDITFTAADAANEMSFTNNGKTVLIIKNASGGSLVVQLVSATCSHGFDNTIDVTTGTLDDSMTRFFGEGWNQSTGVVHIDIATDTSLSLAAVNLGN